MFKNRIERLSRVIEEHEADAALITTTENIFYFTGLTGMWNTTSPTRLIVSRDTHLLVTVRMEEERVKMETGFEPITIRKDVVIDDEAASILKGLEAKTLLFDSISPDILEKFRKEFEGVRFIGSKILELRSVKSREEIEVMRKSAEITAKTLKKAKEFIQPGVRECDVAAEMEYHARKQGAEGVSFPTLVASAERSSLPHGASTQKKIPDDTAILVDFGARYRGYSSDFTRTYLLGNPPKRHLELVKAVMEAYRRSAEKIRAGTDANEAYEEAVKTFRELGLDERFLHSLGHGVGISVHELPVLSWKKRFLQRGNVVTVEPGLYIPGFGGVRVEDTVLVKEDHIEPLAMLEHELFIP